MTFVIRSMCDLIYAVKFLGIATAEMVLTIIIQHCVGSDNFNYTCIEQIQNMKTLMIISQISYWYMFLLKNKLQNRPIPNSEILLSENVSTI